MVMMIKITTTWTSMETFKDDSNSDVKKQSLSLKSDTSVDKAVKSVPDGVENVPSMFPQPACVPQALQPDLAGAGDLPLQAEDG